LSSLRKLLFGCFSLRAGTDSRYNEELCEEVSQQVACGVYNVRTQQIVFGDIDLINRLTNQHLDFFEGKLLTIVVFYFLDS